jgi:hypothetical protein
MLHKKTPDSISPLPRLKLSVLPPFLFMFFLTHAQIAQLTFVSDPNPLTIIVFDLFLKVDMGFPL